MKSKKLIGIFNVGMEHGEINLDVADGEYINIMDGTAVTVRNGKLNLKNKIIIFKIQFDI